MPPDLDHARHIDRFVALFYQRLLNDPLVAPLFFEVARIDLPRHLPTISLYWQKMLLGDGRYQNHTMAKHRAMHHRQPFTEIHFKRWLLHFKATAHEHFAGTYTDKAIAIAENVLKNMRRHMQPDAG